MLYFYDKLQLSDALQIRRSMSCVRTFENNFQKNLHAYLIVHTRPKNLKLAKKSRQLFEHFLFKKVKMIPTAFLESYWNILKPIRQF